ncbi:shikimate dehydrogenase [Nocardioides sp. dk4132]|uniref:shikimate dehydrogenase n=1 Tax=unclassified Nocardioides TaxID=2615069 RepID=UPI0012954B6D|nr:MULTISPECIES: shikimate dehydrogenase [unclassified Nocardioides]MQW74933.1 shikimate dehydrogenase [Nocardioides sp. dk4132]QGA07879.1 shikimate dehydrogenase [Nocardioides sp. dk884]
MAAGRGMRCAVLGDPVAHSLSPTLHRAGYAALGLDWSYDAVRVPAGGLAGFLAGLDETWRGLSLTMPLKREVLDLADEVTDRARLAGAANTWVRGERTLVDNTDLPGAVAAVRERYDGPVHSATILGAGATAASTGLALCELGATRVTLLARSPERAAETVAAIRRHPADPEVVVGSLADGVASGEVLVSTVPADAQTPELLARCTAPDAVFEALYEPWPTPLAAAALESGRALVGGLDLLVHQAVLQFEMFTGRPAPLAQMRAAGEQALVARAGA